jgi:hypothetical protein
MMKKFDVCT